MQLCGVDLWKEWSEYSSKFYESLNKAIDNGELEVGYVVKALADGLSCSGRRCDDCELHKLKNKFDSPNCTSVNGVIVRILLEKGIIGTRRIEAQKSAYGCCKECRNFRGLLGCKLIGCKLEGSWTPTENDYCSKFEPLEE